MDKLQHINSNAILWLEGLYLAIYLYIKTTGSSFSLTLAPPEVVVFEGDTATFICSPYIPPESLNLIRQNSSIVKDPRLSHRDSMAQRTYTLKDVRREDNGERFRCALTGIVSTETLLRVYGKKTCNVAKLVNVYIVLLTLCSSKPVKRIGAYTYVATQLKL